jgi:hypothetical protein
MVVKNKQVEDFLSILFRPGEWTCYAKRPNGTSVFPVGEPPGWVQFFSLNPLHAKSDVEKPDAQEGRRADANCVAFRNILIECDEMEPSDQLDYVKEFGLPWSTCVYSGGKSYHFVISLEPGFQTREEYDRRVFWIHSIMDVIDHSTKNPSRLSRFPGAIRHDKNVEQKIHELRGRVSNEALDAWLTQFPEAEPVRFVPSGTANVSGERGFLSRKTRRFLLFGAPHGEQNSALYLAARDMYQQGWDFDNAAVLLLQPLLSDPSFDEKKSVGTIEQAFKKAPRHPPRLAIRTDELYVPAIRSDEDPEG